MSDHTSALVPLETWAYASPDLKRKGIAADLGLLAEALLYYDRVLINLATQPHLVDLIAWLAKQRRQLFRRSGLELFASLIRDGTIEFYDYSFVSAPVFMQAEGVYTLINMQDSIQAKPNTFEERYLRHPLVLAAFPTFRDQERLIAATTNRVTEVKADAFGAAIEDANNDFNTPKRAALLLQRFVDHIYEGKSDEPPTVQAEVVQQGDRLTLRWNVDMRHLSVLAGTELGFTVASPLAAAITADRLLWSTAHRRCDLYLPSPLSSVVGDKLHEATQKVTAPGLIIDNLKNAVEFPDIRGLVNEGRLSLRDVLKIRKKAKRFRQWLQTESQRDRDAIVAYHNEIAKESKLTKATCRTVSLFAAAAGAYAGSVAGPEAAAAAGAASLYVTDLATQLRAGWRPVIFGRWLEDRIKQPR